MAEDTQSGGTRERLGSMNFDDVPERVGHFAQSLCEVQHELRAEGAPPLDWGEVIEYVSGRMMNAEQQMGVEEKIFTWTTWYEAFWDVIRVRNAHGEADALFALAHSNLEHPAIPVPPISEREDTSTLKVPEQSHAAAQQLSVPGSKSSCVREPILRVAAAVAVAVGVGYGIVAYARMANTLSEREVQLVQIRKELTQAAEKTIIELRGLHAVLKGCDRLLKDRDPSDPLRSEIQKLIIAVQMESTKLSVHALRSPMVPGDKARWIQDLGVADDTDVRPGEKITRIWKIKNVGSVLWKNRFLQREDDPAIPGRLKSERRVLIPDTPPGNECDIRVDFLAPEESGVSYSEWKMVDADGNYLLSSQTPLFIRVNVVGKN